MGSPVIEGLLQTLDGAPPVRLQIRAVIALADDITWIESWVLGFWICWIIWVQFNPANKLGSKKDPSMTYLLLKSRNGYPEPNLLKIVV